VTLHEDYNGNICEDIIKNEFIIDNSIFTKGNLIQLIKNKKNDTLNGNRFLIFSTNSKLLDLEVVVNKSGRHKASEYNVRDLTLCNLIEEDVSIFKSANIDKFRKEKLIQLPDKEGYITIENKNLK
jgi:predicted phage tail protein